MHNFIIQYTTLIYIYEILNEYTYKSAETYR